MEAPSSSLSSRVAPAPSPLLPPVRYYMLDEHDEEEEEWLSRPTSPGGEPPGPCVGAGWLPPPMSPRTWKAAAAAAQQPEPPQDQEEDPESEPYPYDERTLYAPRLDPAARQHLQTSLATSAAEDALHHYNADAGNKVKLELTRATRYAGLLNSQGSYHHVNFFARAMNEDDASSSSMKRKSASSSPSCTIRTGVALVEPGYGLRLVCARWTEKETIRSAASPATGLPKLDLGSCPWITASRATMR